jgi:general secretion pathway protein N
MSMRIWVWLLTAVITLMLSTAVFLPVSWVSVLIERQSGGRLTLGDAQGSFWQGSAFVGGATSANSPVTPLFDGRFSWKISPLILLGQLELQISNERALSKTVRISGNFSDWQVSAASLKLPTERLEGLGAPLNTIGLGGQLSVFWDNLQFSRQEKKVSVTGGMTLDMQDMTSRLSPIKPLGSYRMQFDWHGDAADMNLRTVRGPMLLSGKGSLQQGRLQFSGKAEAEAGQEEKLANLLNLLGQRRKDGDKDVIALEFK